VAIVPFQAFADSSHGGIVVRHVLVMGQFAIVNCDQGRGMTLATRL